MSGRVQVVWPDGRLEEWTGVAPGQWITLTEGTGRAVGRASSP